jgi:tetrahydromethanopterin S-methyltransferase subunit G
MSSKKDNKKPKVEAEEIDLSEEELDPAAEAALEEISKIEEKLSEIEDLKGKKLEEVNREFEIKKYSLYRERATHFQKLPHFWSKVVRKVNFNNHEILV